MPATAPWRRAVPIRLGVDALAADPLALCNKPLQRPVENFAQADLSTRAVEQLHLSADRHRKAIQRLAELLAKSPQHPHAKRPFYEFPPAFLVLSRQKIEAGFFLAQLQQPERPRSNLL